MSNIIRTKLNFDALAYGKEANINFQEMKIAYSIPEHVESEIDDVANHFKFDAQGRPLSAEEKQRQIDEKLLNETECHGYFFDYVSNMNFKHLYLETCNDTLDTYILEYATNKKDFQWTILQKICFELVNSVAWLHRRKLYYNGRLHPRNIFMKTSGTSGLVDTPWNVKLQVSEKPNPFPNLDTEYVNLWSGLKKSDVNTDEKAIQRDLFSVAILIFFIQSVGFHPFQMNSIDPVKRSEYPAIQKQLEKKKFKLVVLDRKCFCEVKNENCEELQCKYRHWVNMLAKDCTHTMLTELSGEKSNKYTEKSSEKLMEHPFFWKTPEVLRFIEESSNYLKDKKDSAKIGLFTNNEEEKNTDTVDSDNEDVPNHKPWILSSALLLKLSKTHEDIFNYLCLRYKKKIQINDFYDLLCQIRNKSTHWYEPSECEIKAKDKLKKISFEIKAKDELKKISEVDSEVEADSEMDAKHKFCLFWNIHFPTLILYTWNNLKDVVSYPVKK